MTAPDDPAWLIAMLRSSPVLPDEALREHWANVVPWFPVELRYELAGILMDVELACERR